MTNFARMWLELVKICPEIGKLFTPDSKQDWVCPECYQKRPETCLDTPYCPSFRHDNYPKGPKLQPIPRLDQLVRMVQTSPKELFWDDDGSCVFTMFDYNEAFRSDSPEEAVLLGIAYEHGFELTEGKWTGKEEKWTTNKFYMHY